MYTLRICAAAAALDLNIRSYERGQHYIFEILDNQTFVLEYNITSENMRRNKAKDVPLLPVVLVGGAHHLSAGGEVTAQSSL